MRVKRVVFRIAALIGALCVFLAIEGALRMAGVPKRGALFFQSDGSVQFSQGAATRYFSASAEYVPEAHPEIFRSPKPPDTWRIICLGGSTMAGYPYTHNGALPSLIRDRLIHFFPQKRIEVLNLAVPAVGSYTVFDMCRHAMRYQPDLFIVYSGHNEFYGALGAGSTQAMTAPREMVLLHLRMQDFALYRLLWLAGGFLRGGHTVDPHGPTLMARMVEHTNIDLGSETYQRALEVFSRNLRGICSLCSDKEVPLMVCELVSNLKDQPPFAPCSPAEDGSAGGPDHRGSGSTEESADELYRLAIQTEREGAKEKARCLFIMAKDRDGLRFRASSEFNDTLRAVGMREGALVAPLGRIFQNASLFSAPGYDLFIDHLHPNLEGYMLMARSIVETLRHSSVLAPRDSWPREQEETEGINRDMALVTHLEHAMAYDKISRLMSHWPFSLSQRRPVYSFEDSILALAMQYHDEDRSWTGAHLSACDYYLRHGKARAARREAKAILKQAAAFWPAWLKVGDSYLSEGKALKAIEAYEAAGHWAEQVGAPPGLALAKKGAACLAADQPMNANRILHHALRPENGLSDIERSRARYLLALSLLQLGRPEEARAMAQELRREKGGRELAGRILAHLHEK